jgi:hypothetical protein
MQIGMNLSVTEEGKKVAIGHFKKARAIYNLVGMIHEAKQMDTHISMQFTNMQAANNGGTSFIVTHSALEAARNSCERKLSEKGMNSEFTIVSGTLYVGRVIQAERLITELVTVSRRVLGPDHNITLMQLNC